MLAHKKPTQQTNKQTSQNKIPAKQQKPNQQKTNKNAQTNQPKKKSPNPSPTWSSESNTNKLFG